MAPRDERALEQVDGTRVEGVDFLTSLAEVM